MSSLRHSRSATYVVVAWFLVASSLSWADDPAESLSKQAALVKGFLSNYCLECHQGDSAQGDRDFSTFKLPIDNQQKLITTKEIIDQLTLREMPPEDAKKAPSDDERLAALTALRSGSQLGREKLQTTGGRTVIRRLSTREYENTLEILFGRRVDTLGLTAEFPKENTTKHMDNIGESLVTSGFLLDSYFQAAHRLVERRLAKPAMELKTWHFTNNFRQYEELTGSHKNVFNFEYLCLYEQPNTDTRQGGYGHIEDFLAGVPVSGLYDIEVLAKAFHRDTHYDPKIFRIDFSEPFQLAVVPGDVTKGHIHYPQAIEPILAFTIVPDEEFEWLKFQVWLEAGQTPRFIFPNGPYESRASVIEVNKRYKDEFEGKGYKAGVSRAHILRHGALPHIRIGEIKVHGPLQEPSGGKEEVAVFGSEGYQKDRAIDQLYAFAQRAYRRPLEPSDRARIEAMYQKRLSAGVSPRQAALDTLKLILCSPSFLYLSEITSEGEVNLRPYDLASRLSYTLWAGPPDDELLAVAASGAITKTKELEKQVARLLADPRSNEFVDGFLDSWLNLRDIGNLPPPRRTNREYYAENLPQSMKDEARMFLRHLIENDGPVTDLLVADYTFVDKKLAKLYGLPERNSLRLADGFQRVTLAKNSQRGGVLGMAGVLTVSANGVETSPVTRGVWVMENILGITPPPPPDEVPEIEANVSGATTIRERLAKHRTDEACNVCHRKIDSLGFALESFDPIGRWRTSYSKAAGKTARPKVDTSGKFPSGESYSDFTSFKKVLVSTRQEIFTRNLIEKLATYSTGRVMEPGDQYEIDDILHSKEVRDHDMRGLLIKVLTSQIFRSP